MQVSVAVAPAQTIRGYTAIGLHRPKTPANIGSVLRAAGCFGVDLIMISGERGKQSLRRISTDTQKAWRHIPTLEVGELFDSMPLGAIPVAVDLLPNAIPLPNYVHPERAFYIFGPEDSTLGKAITSRCRDTIVIPSYYCLNLAASVNVILYDRAMKLGK